MTKFWLALCILLITTQFTNAQLRYANTLFEESDYEAAAHIYEKEFSKDSTDLLIIERLAFCNKKLNRYEKAEKYYSKAIEFEDVDNESYFHYGQILKNLNKIHQARDQFQIYLEKQPNSIVGRLALRSCEAIKEWTSKPSEFELSNVEAINTEYIEYGPYPFGNKLVFTSSKNYLVEEETGKVKKSAKKAATSIYIYDSTDTENPIKSFSDNINSYFNVEGPAYFNGNNEVMYFTKTYDRQRNITNQMEVHSATMKNDEWTNDNRLHFNDQDYSFTSPVVSQNGKQLYFASDKPYGEGEFDIYVVEILENDFGDPVNIGDMINTPGSEFPSYIDKEGNLYFSSSYLPGFGGLDIFKSKNIDGKWSTPKNIKSPFNSSKDELHYIMTDSVSGYFASNRDGGKGKDDIYYFTKHYFSDSSYYTDISGLFLLDTLPMIAMTLTLLDENDEIVQTLVTDEKGAFTFVNIAADRSYKILIDEDPEKVPDEAKIYLTDDRYQKIMLIERLKKGLFEFKALKRDDYMGLSLMDEVDDAGLPTLVVMGQLSNKTTGEKPAGKRIFVVDAFGNTISSTMTDHLGQFKFEKLRIDDQYLFKLEEEDVELDIYILNKDGNVMGKTMKNKDGIYVYHKFTINPSGAPDIRGLFRYGNLPADGVTLYLLNEDDEMVQITQTNVKGEFEFLKLDPGSNYKIKVDSMSKIPGNANLFLMDKHTGILMPVSKLSNGLFKFETLAPIPPEELELMEEEDYVLKPRQNLRGRIENTVTNQAPVDLVVQIVNEDGIVIAVAKTDERGEFKFFNLPIDDQYLFNLPEDDVNYKLSVLNQDKVVIGEAARNKNSQFVYHKFSINPSKNPDIRGMFKYGNLPANGVSLNLINEDDELLQFTKTDMNGNFEFKGLKAGQVYQVKVDPKMGQLPGNTNMYILDEYTGLMLPVSKLSNGLFKFETLAPMDVEDLELMEEKGDESLSRFSFFGQLFDKLPMDIAEGLEIYIVDDDGSIIATAIVDRFGKFKYEKLPIQDEYLLRISEDDVNYRLRVMSQNGEILGELERNANGDFVFNRIELEEKRKDDSEKDDLQLSEKPYVYFDFGKSTLNYYSKTELVKAVKILNNDGTKKIEISSHTDSRGAAEYNMWLSEQRSASINSYLTEKGIKSNRIIVRNYGETKLLNECADGVPCSMEKHAENRRTELKIIK